MNVKTMTLDEAIDFASDLYMAGLVDVNVSSFATADEVTALLARWNVQITD